MITIEQRIALVQRRIGRTHSQHKLREQHQLLAQLRTQLATTTGQEATS